MSAFIIVWETVTGIAAGVLALVVLNAWIWGGAHSLGLPGGWAHLIAVVALIVYSNSALDFARDAAAKRS